MNCPICNAPVSEDNKKCPICGSNLQISDLPGDNPSLVDASRSKVKGASYGAHMRYSSLAIISFCLSFMPLVGYIISLVDQAKFYKTNNYNNLAYGNPYYYQETYTPSAIVLILVLCFLPAIITGHMARREILLSNGVIAGRGFALTGLILGYLVPAMFILGIILSVVFNS